MKNLIKLLFGIGLIGILSAGCVKNDEIAKIHSAKEGYTLSISKKGVIHVEYNGKKFYLSGNVKEGLRGLEIKREKEGEGEKVLIKYFNGTTDSLEYLGKGLFR